MEDRLANAKEGLQTVLADQRRHVMTYNHYYTDNIQNSRQKRRTNHYLNLLHQMPQKQSLTYADV